MFTFESLTSHGVPHGVTERTAALPANGDFSFISGSDSEIVVANRQAWCSEIGVSVDRLICPRQVHGAEVAIVDDKHAGRGARSVDTALHGYDALVTLCPGLPLAVLSADCATLLFYDPVKKVIASAHAGWRGTIAGIAGKVVETLRTGFDVDSQDLVVCLGPAICVDCYQVGDEVVDAWNDSAYASGSRATARGDDGEWRFDIVRANLESLSAHGVARQQVELSGQCTRCANGRYFSRRGLGPRTGLLASIIALPDVRSIERVRTI